MPVVLCILALWGLLWAPGVSQALVVSCITRVAVQTDTNNQTITCPELGTTVPKAAILMLSTATADNTAASHALLSVGVTDCTNVGTMGGRTQDIAAGSTNSDIWGYTTHLLTIPTVNADTVDADADLVGCIAGGMTIDWVTAPAAAYLLQVWFLGGSEIRSSVGTVTGSASIGGTTTITPNFETHLLFVIGFRGAFDGTVVTAQRPSIGWMSQTSGVITQRVLSWFSNGGQATSADLSSVSESWVYHGCNATDCVTTKAALEVTGVSATQVTFTTRIEAQGDPIVYLALNVGTRRHWVGTINTPTTASTVNVTSPGFRPQTGMLLMDGVATVATVESDGDAGYMGASFLRRSAGYSLAIAMEDNVATGSADAQSLVDDVAFNVPSQTGAALFTGTHSMTATGVDLVFSATDGTVRRWIGALVEESAAERRRGRQFWGQ